MNTNFKFLKSINNKLFEIITDAEKLYRDEYFEQCIVQIRRFGEQMCKDMLIQNNFETGSFDEMIEILKDNSNGTVQEKEFIDDLYFIKKNGNKVVHSEKGEKQGMVALECLQRAFELSINYCVHIQGASRDILKLNYDVELLVTEKKSKKSLKEKYVEEKQKQAKQEIQEKPKKQPKKAKKIEKEKNINECSSNNEIEFKLSLFWKFIAFLLGISCLTILFLIIAVAITK
jgi:hypothetical protein